MQDLPAPFRHKSYYMRASSILWTLLLVSLPVFGQERVSVKGRIINQHGKAVEYVQVGIPKLQLGTISSADGLFELTAPCDTLQFFHVSYQTKSYIVTGPADDVVIVLHENELPPAVFLFSAMRHPIFVELTILSNS